MRTGTIIFFLALLSVMEACKPPAKEAVADPPSAGPGKRQSQDSTDSATPFKAPEKFASAFAGYRSRWTRLTGYEYSGLHWGQFISLYVNKDPDTYVRNYLEYMRLYVDADIDEAPHGEEKHFEPYAVGTIFLKENFRAESGLRSTPLSVTVMIKRERGYDLAINDWEFIQYDVSGNILFDGNSRDAATRMMCIKCHGNISERDFIFSTFHSLSPSGK